MTDIIVFTDGASLGNPGPGGWGAVVVEDREKVYEIGGHDENTTNNRMELQAAMTSLDFIQSNLYDARERKHITIYSDSAYVVNGITKWVENWVKNGWRTKGKSEVQNRDLWERLYAISRGVDIDWKRISGHSGFPGNVRADEIAVSYANDEKPTLFHGLIEDYDRDVLNFSYDKELKKEREEKKTHARAKAYSYLSLVDDIPMRHETWDETKKRVQGVASAKYRKAISPDHEQEILEEWGYSRDDVKHA